MEPTPEFETFYRKHFFHGEPEEVFQARMAEAYKLHGGDFVDPEAASAKLEDEIAKACGGPRHDVSLTSHLADSDDLFRALLAESARWDDSLPVLLRVDCGGGFDEAERVLRSYLTGQGRRKLIVAVTGICKSAATGFLFECDFSLAMSSAVIGFHSHSEDSTLVATEWDCPWEAMQKLPPEKLTRESLIEARCTWGKDAFVRRCLRAGKQTREHLESVAREAYTAKGREFSALQAFELGLIDRVI